MSKKDKSDQLTELDYRKEVLEEGRQLAMREGFHGKVEAYPFMGEATLSLEDRLRIAIMLGTPDTVQRMLELGADVTDTGKGINLMHLAEIHGRDDLITLLKAHIVEAVPSKKPKNPKA